jgi:hypothetical protein
LVGNMAHIGDSSQSPHSWEWHIRLIIPMCLIYVIGLMIKQSQLHKYPFCPEKGDFILQVAR